MSHPTYKQFYSINGRFIPKIMGGKGGKGCFSPNTRVLTNVGYKFIKDINLNDLVMSFNHEGKTSYNRVISIYRHNVDTLSRVELWNGSVIYATSNHWFCTEDYSFKELRHFAAEEALIGKDNRVYPIKSIELDCFSSETYNLTVENDHTYIIEDVFVHNKGASKAAAQTSSPTESDDTLFSTDILFVLTALGEGPIYRVNSNGPQDIEINEGTIDDLLNLNGDGLINPELFYYTYTTGVLNQASLKAFGEELVVPQSLSNPVSLKYGNIPGIPPAKISFMSTSTGVAWDALSFKFVINSLLVMDQGGNIVGNGVFLNINVWNSNATKLLVQVPHQVIGKSSGAFKFAIDVIIPPDDVSSDGYKFEITKTSYEFPSSKMQDSITFYGWEEIQFGERSYPRTALAGYAIKATSEYKGNIPSVSSMVKGLICRVPSNYNQPILENGEIDWREVEVGSAQRISAGYRLQQSGDTVQTDANPVIYTGLWDGSFVYNWTQNPVWIVFDILTNTTYGLGIPIDLIDKYNFYKVAQYCDAVESKTGKYVGVTSIADGSWRHKPRGSYTGNFQVLQGLPNGTAIDERRFICDLILSARKQIMDTINQITAIFRGILFYSAGKLTLNVDMPDELPMAVFNETNIIDGSLVISGTKESEIITGVEISFVDPLNHYKRETIRISDDNILREVNHIENVKTLDLTGCTRRGQALRFGQYLLASGKYLRRKVEFKTSVEAISLTVGDIISVATRVTGTTWGYAGRVLSNSTVGTSNVYLEHFTVPGLSNSIFTANSDPLALRILKQNSDRVDYYLLSNTNFALQNTGNVTTGYDSGRVTVVRRFNPTTKSWDSSPYTWTANTVPVRHDLWTLGEVDPNNIFTSQSDKLFKITQLQRTEDHDIQINAIEYISNVYIDSETQIAYEPVQYKDFSSFLSIPPTPVLGLVSRPVRGEDGGISYVIDINCSTDTTNYPLAISTQFEIAYPDEIADITGLA